MCICLFRIQSSTQCLRQLLQANLSFRFCSNKRNIHNKGFLIGLSADLIIGFTKFFLSEKPTVILDSAWRPKLILGDTHKPRGQLKRVEGYNLPKVSTKEGETGQNVQKYLFVVYGWLFMSIWHNSQESKI